MIDLSNPQDVKAVQKHLKIRPMGDPEVMVFLEQLCGWFDFKETEPDKILIQHGKRQVLATIKTLLHYGPEEIVALAKTQ